MTTTADPTIATTALGAEKRSTRGSDWATRRPAIALYQILLVAAFLAAWQWLPSWSWLSERVEFLDPFYISSPGRVLTTVIDLAFGRNNSVVVWPYLARTLVAAVLGLAIGMVAGGLLGLIFSSSDLASKVLMPFINAINATPRIAFVPIIVVILGPTRAASVTIAVLVVFFVALFNAIEGGRTVPEQAIQNAQLLGGTRIEIMRHVRLKYVIAWCFAVLPTALAFALVSVVTAEVFTGYEGVGRLLLTATATVNSDLTFALATYLAITGLVLVTVAEHVKRRILHWWR